MSFSVDMSTNEVSVTVVKSKEFVPVLTICGDIMRDVLEEVMKRIAKAKAPKKKTKTEVVRKPAARKVVEEGSRFSFNFLPSILLVFSPIYSLIIT